MEIYVKAKPRTKHASVAQLDVTHFRVCVTELAKEGRANDAVRTALADHLDIPQSRIRLIAGQRYKEKVFEIVVGS